MELGRKVMDLHSGIFCDFWFGFAQENISRDFTWLETTGAVKGQELLSVNAVLSIRDMHGLGSMLQGCSRYSGW